MCVSIVKFCFIVGLDFSMKSVLTQKNNTSNLKGY